MECALILEHCNDSLFAWHQHWINVHEFGPMLFPPHHPLLMQCHITEEHIIAIFHHIRSLMAIHVNALPQHLTPSTQIHEPLPSCVFQQPICEGVPERWEDALVQHATEA